MTLEGLFNKTSMEFLSVHLKYRVIRTEKNKLYL